VDISPLLSRPGAVAADGQDAGVAAHYGDPFREQRALEEAAGVVDRSHRDVLAVTGPDRLSWLHSLTTQHLTELPAGRGTETLVLSPHGHVEHHALVADDGTTTWLDVEPGTGPALLAFLESMRFLLRVEPADVTRQWAILSVVGPTTDEALARLGAVPVAAYDVASLPGGGWVRRMPWPGAGGADLLVPRGDLAEVVQRLSVPVAGMWAYEAMRVADRRPRHGRETDHRTLAQEVGWLETAVHLDKGCYRGQETVARVHNLGRPPRRLVLLHLDGSVESLPGSGDPVLAGDRQVGFVTTAARHYELGPIALALVKRNTPDQGPLHIGEVTAAIEPEAVPAGA
jgi:folate-binding protein YgfZ